MRLSHFALIFALFGLLFLFALLGQARPSDRVYAQQFTPANTMTLMPDTPIPSLTPTQTPIPPTPRPSFTPAPTLTPIPDEHDLILYASDRDAEEAGQFNIYLHNLTTGDVIQITQWTSANAPHLSSDRRWLVYEARFSGTRSFLAVLDLQSYNYNGYSITMDITDFMLYDPGAPAWSPDGAYVAYHSNENGNFDLYVLTIERGSGDPHEVVQITTSREDDLYPSWSPDGLQLVYQCTMGGGREICIIDRDGENLRHLTSNARFDGLPSWSPDGLWIAFAAAYDSDNEDLYMMDTQGRNLRRLTNRPESRDTNPKWSRDGARIAFESDANGNFDVCILTLATEEITCITDNPSTDWSPTW